MDSLDHEVCSRNDDEFEYTVLGITVAKKREASDASLRFAT